MSDRQDAPGQPEEQKLAEQMEQMAEHLAQMKELLKRPDSGGIMPMDVIKMLIEDFTIQKEFIEMYSAHLNATDRKRLNGVGVKKQGFIDRALMLATENPEFLPCWLTVDKFRGDNERSTALRALFDIHAQHGEILWNLVMQSADVSSTDALAFYASVREAARRRVDTAESPYNELHEFYKNHGKKKGGALTEQQLKRDVNALLNGTKNGRVSIEHVSPKAVGGEHKVVDETFNNTA